ncbi:ParA family protein [Saccharopolyspora sp. NPDC049357]|uniref:ParA family protein n=1 Tax=Saccharopolyspora sp. NPDC049357 TaxID=3154507 RepID=UPI0034315584
MARRAAAVNDKGGVGRTLLIRLFAEYLARWHDLNVLMVDLDHQAILSRRVGFDMWGRDAELPNAAGLFDRRIQAGDAADFIHPIRWDHERFPWAARIHIIPGHEALQDVEEDGHGNPSGRVRRALDGADDGYDVTLFDTRPDFGKRSQAAWAASHDLFGVTEPWRDEMEGVARLLQRVLDFRDDLDNKELDIAGIIINEFNNPSEHIRNNIAKLERAATAQRVWTDCPLPNRRFITEQMSTGEPFAAMTNVKNTAAIDAAVEPLIKKFLEVTGVGDA